MPDLNTPKASHYLYFPTEDEARAAVRDMGGKGLESAVRLGADEVNWLVLVQHAWPLGAEEFDRIQELLRGITDAHSGEYDGWETPVEP
jgi:hypothetical protein